MERFEGYAPKRIRTARVERLLAADRVLCRARRWLTALLSVAAIAAALAIVLLIVKGIAAERPWLPVAIGGGYLALVILSLLLLFLFRLFYGGGSPKGEERYRLLNKYVQALLIDTCVMLAPQLRALENGEAHLADAREYAERYVLTGQEWAALYHEPDPRAEGERIRARFEEYLREVIEGESGRYLALRANMKKVIEEWRRLHFHLYAEPQRRLLEENFQLLIQQVTEHRAFFLQTRGTHAYLELLNRVTLYRDKSLPPEDGNARALPLPTREEYTNYLSAVEEIRQFDAKGLRYAMQGRRLASYKELLDSYRGFHATRAMTGCQTVDLARCEGYVKTAELDATRCWRCKHKFHPRYKRVCHECQHHVCPRCGSCYCDKHISHRFFRFVDED